ncbi:MAG: hypothetical protein KatS3mg087_1431 [Patescibacteria group bacterium]|nr:MAG: hypothetical protein KatS3mg087_1431 [Patescibacteria group bacterium]
MYSFTPQGGLLNQIIALGVFAQSAFAISSFFSWLNLTSIDLLIIHFFYIPFNLLLALKNRDWPFFQGFLHAFSKIYLVVQQRTHSPSFVRSDNQILSSFKSDV